MQQKTVDTSRTAKRSDLMTEGAIWKKIVVFSVPLILGNLLQQMYSTVDSIIVGNYVGSNALAAVGSSTALINLLIAFSQGASVGAGVVVSQYIGAKDKRGLRAAVHTALTIAGILGLVLTVAGIFLSRQLLIWMQTPADVLEDSVRYLRVYSGGLICSVVYNMATGILNAAGNSRRPLLYLGVASVVNIALDILLIEGFHMGVEGAAIATDASQLVSCVLAMAFLMRTKADYRVSLRRLRIQKNVAIRILKVGLPAGIQSMVISLSNVLVQSSVNSFGATEMAGFGAYLKIDGFNILPVLSISMASTTFVGQNYGAGKIDRVKKGMWVTLLIGLVYTVALGILLSIFSEPVMRLFTDDTAVIESGKQVMRYFCPFYFLLSILYGLVGTVRGTGKSIPPMVVLLFSFCVFRIFWIQLAVPQFGSSRGVYVLYPISWTIGAVSMVLYAWKGKWLTSASKLCRK